VDRKSIIGHHGDMLFARRLVTVLSVLLACTSDPPAKVSATSGTDAGAQDAAPVLGLRFVAVGDTGKGNAGQKAVASAIKQVCDARGCDFVTVLGDNIYESGLASADDPLAKSLFEDIYAGIDVDFQMVLGNHDYGGGGLGNEFDKALNEVAYSAKSSKWKMPAPHYRFQKAEADFFVLDTNLMMFNKQAPQETDVPKWIAESKAPWKIALGHHPYKSNGPHGNAGSYDGFPAGNDASGAGLKKFFDSYVCGKTDVYFSAHDHSLQALSDTCAGTALFVSGAGATATALSKKNTTTFESRELGFAYVTVTNTTLSVDFVDQNGNVLHTETLQK
jgi:tartrate-resistant acid phosphatase type 5